MDDGPVVLAERGVLTVPDEVWNLAARRAAVIRPLAEAGAVGHTAADAAAAELGVSRRQVYLMVRRWRAGEGVVSDLVPGRSSGGRGRGHLPDEVEAVVRELLRARYGARGPTFGKVTLRPILGHASSYVRPTLRDGGGLLSRAAVGRCRAVR